MLAKAAWSIDGQVGQHLAVDVDLQPSSGRS
jgi:hypothetical protein